MILNPTFSLSILQFFILSIFLPNNDIYYKFKRYKN